MDSISHPEADPCNEFSLVAAQSTENAPMLDWALRYASQGWHVFPAHVPLHDHPTGYRCTCEFYRHSDECRANHPHLHMAPDRHCENPGKCPAVRWRERSTTDPDQIRKWWGRPWPFRLDGATYSVYMNLAIDCGRSGLLVLDADTYKDAYAGADLLSPQDEETVTAITGGGGTHLYYRTPEGAGWGNATGDLPPGIDVRGAGGYVIAPPSRHKSGNHYQWKLGYGPDGSELLPVPAWLATILDQAQARTATARARFTTPTTERPDLGRWSLPQRALDAIHNPAPKGERSEADFSVACSLIRAGLADDQILAVFQHYPIGADGKYAERGDDYLARTIGNARGRMEKFARDLATMRLWALGTSFAGLVPAELRSSRGYRTDATDTKVFDAILDIAERVGRFDRLQFSIEQIRAACNLGSKATARGGIERLLAAGLVEREKVEGANWFLYRLVVLKLNVLIKNRGCDLSVQFSHGESPTSNEYTPHKADDAFALGRSRTMRNYVKDLAPLYGEVPVRVDILDRNGAVLEPHVDHDSVPDVKEDLRSQGYVDIRTRIVQSPKHAAWDAHTLAPLGEPVLRVIDTLAREGRPMTRVELVTATGKVLSAIASATRRGETLELFDVEEVGPRHTKVYSLAEDVWERIEALVLRMRTYQIGTERKERAAEQTQRWCERELKKDDLAPDARLDLERRRERAVKRRFELVPILHPKWTSEEVEKWILAPSPTSGPPIPHSGDKGRAEWDAGLRLHNLEVARQEWDNLQRSMADLRTQGVPRRDWFRMLILAGFSKVDVKIAMAGGAA